MASKLIEDLRNSLEDLFQTLPISAEQLRAWCHQAMPKGKPHEISTDANRLDLLEWLIDRGRLANGQAPLLTVLRHVFTQKKIAALQSNWDRLSQKLAVLEKHCIDETRAEEKFRLQSLIDATQSERDRIEQQLLKRVETLTESDPNEQRLLRTDRPLFRDLRRASPARTDSRQDGRNACPAVAHLAPFDRQALPRPGMAVLFRRATLSSLHQGRGPGLKSDR